jgi:diketogulonate reductase-like aldo/keto reductase
MKYESLPNTSTRPNGQSVQCLTLPKIGFGTARLGGFFIPNRSQEKRWLTALRSALELGYTHFDTAEVYSSGYSEELIGRTVRREAGAKREDVFITTKIWPTHLRYQNVLRSCESSLRRLRTDYLDLYLIHWPNPFIPLNETFRALNQLVLGGKVRYLGVSNFSLQRLKEAQTVSETPIRANQVLYNISTRSYVKNGMLEYCQQNNILLTAYRPIEHGHVHTNKTIQAIADAHHATPYQIALAWLVMQPRVIAIPMSFNPLHQIENLRAADIELSEAEIEQLNQTR